MDGLGVRLYRYSHKSLGEPHASQKERHHAEGGKRQVNKGAKAKQIAKLPESMLGGKASAAKAKDGDQPVFDYIASLPEPQRSIARRVDELAAKTLPELKRSVKWGIAYYGVGQGWCFCCGGFADHVKLMFVNGATLLSPSHQSHLWQWVNSRAASNSIIERFQRNSDCLVDATNHTRTRSG